MDIVTTTRKKDYTKGNFFLGRPQVLHLLYYFKAFWSGLHLEAHKIIGRNGEKTYKLYQIQVVFFRVSSLLKISIFLFKKIETILTSLLDKVDLPYLIFQIWKWKCNFNILLKGHFFRYFSWTHTFYSFVHFPWKFWI